MYMHFLRPGLILSALLMLVLAACSDKGPLDSATQDAGLLSWVPAEAPYVFANTRPIPDAALDKILSDADRMLTYYRDLLVDLQGQGLDAEDRQGFEAILPLLEELDGKVSREGLGKLGFKANAKVVVYGAPLLPAGRSELSDAQKFWDFIGRMEQRLGIASRRSQAEGLEYSWIDIEGLKLIFGTRDQHLVWALVPIENEAEALAALASDTGPAENLATTGEFTDMQTLHDFPGYGDGYFDLLRFSDALEASRGDLAHQDIQVSDACSVFVRDTLGAVPRMVLGTTDFNTRLYRTRMVVETSPAVGQVLARIGRPVAGVGRDTDAIFAMGLGLDIPQLRGGLRSALRHIAQRGAACEWVNAQAIEGALPTLEMALGPMTAMFQGLYLEVANLELDPATQTPKALDMQVLVDVDDPRGLLAMAGLMSPGLADLEVPQDGSPVVVPGALLPPGTPPMQVAIQDNSLVVVAGEDATNKVQTLLAAIPLSPPPLFALSYNFERLGELMQAGTDGAALGGTLPEGMSQEEFRAQMDAMIDLYSAYSHYAMQVWADDKGLTLEQTIGFRED